jgi:hypothetical protein
MKVCVVAALGAMMFFGGALADELNRFRTAFGESWIETRDLRIDLRPSGDDVYFTITLHSSETGMTRVHRFEGEGSEDASPFQILRTGFCGTPIILLTVKYPWQHALPQYGWLLDTFAFRESDFAFIDVAFGPVTDIAIADDSAYDPADLEMLPPVRVHCLDGQDGKPFEFSKEATK